MPGDSLFQSIEKFKLMGLSRRCEFFITQTWFGAHFLVGRNVIRLEGRFVIYCTGQFHSYNVPSTRLKMQRWFGFIDFDGIIFQQPYTVMCVEIAQLFSCVKLMNNFLVSIKKHRWIVYLQLIYLWLRSCFCLLLFCIFK